MDSNPEMLSLGPRHLHDFVEVNTEEKEFSITICRAKHLMKMVLGNEGIVLHQNPLEDLEVRVDPDTPQRLILIPGDDVCKVGVHIKHMHLI